MESHSNHEMEQRKKKFEGLSNLYQKVTITMKTKYQGDNSGNGDISSWKPSWIRDETTSFTKLPTRCKKCELKW